MKNMKYARTLVTLALVLVVLGSIVGGTIAWFTDEVTSTSNVVKSGTLDLTFEYKEKLADEWKNADSAAIFDYKYWEPGYTQVRYVKVANVGDLAFKYEMNVKPASVFGEVTVENDGKDPEDYTFTPTYPEPEYKLEDMIEVYFAPAAEYASFDEIKAAAETAPITIAYMIETEGAMKGVLLPAEGKGSNRVPATAPANADVGEVEYCIALHMKEEAGNEYQNLSISDGFAVQLQATQYTYEEDSFDNTYDTNAEFANLPSAVVIPLDVETVKAETGVPVQAAYRFRTTDTPDPANNPELLSSPYFYWHADFVVSFDDDMEAGTFNLAGQYDMWDEKWVDVDSSWLGKDYVKGDEIRLLGEVGKAFNGGDPIYVNYAELCAGIQKFDCGAYNKAAVNVGKTMTVELRIYETEAPSAENGNSVNVETGRFETIGRFNYTFDSVVGN
ncbi:MAG: hypothetical protein E7320_02995 [Clostridiales bacterium]|nr:hypothetical protein [Clostridiales bacterium]